MHVGNIAVEFGIEEAIDSFCPVNRGPRATTSRHGSSGGVEILRPGTSTGPSGRLSLVIRSWGFGHRKSWRDGKRQKLEDLLNDFIASILRTAERRRIDRDERERQEREEAELRLKRELEQARRELEAARRRDLEERVRKFEFAASVRRLVDSVANDSPDAGSEAIAWIHWARTVADELQRAATTVRLPATPSAATATTGASGASFAAAVATRLPEE